jgi:hypothetical protein
VYPVRYKLGFYIPGDSILHSHRHENLKFNIVFQGLYETVSLCFHPFGVVLAAGSTEGHLVVLNAENGAPVVTIRVCGSPLNCLGYNPGNFLSNSQYQTSLFIYYHVTIFEAVLLHSFIIFENLHNISDF